MSPHCGFLIAASVEMARMVSKRKRIIRREWIEWRHGCKEALNGMLYFYIPKVMRRDAKELYTFRES